MFSRSYNLLNVGSKTVFVGTTCPQTASVLAGKKAATMDLHQLRIFVTVAAEKNLTRGAQRLYMTPPTVSAHIKALEDELGVTLFVSTAKGMQLTDNGRLLYAKAEHTLQAALSAMPYLQSPSSCYGRMEHVLSLSARKREHCSLPQQNLPWPGWLVDPDVAVPLLPLFATLTTVHGVYQTVLQSVDGHRTIRQLAQLVGKIYSMGEHDAIGALANFFAAALEEGVHRNDGE